MKNKLVVYTALFGDYDDLIRPKEYIRNKLILKATYDSGSILFVKDKRKIDFRSLKEIEQNLKINYDHYSKEWEEKIGSWFEISKDLSYQFKYFNIEE